MIKLGVFVGENNWTFFHNIYAELSHSFKTQVFKRRDFNVPVLSGRLNRWGSSHEMQMLLNNSDVCFFEWASDLLAIASQMPRRCRMITRLHSFELYDWAPKINWNNVDKIIVLSEAMRVMFSELYPDHAHKLIVIHNGCSLTKFNFVPEKNFEFTLGMLCHIAPIKRIYEIVLMLHKLRSKGYSASLRIGGIPDDDGRYTVALHRLVAELNLQDKVVFDGFVDDAPAWLKRIDIFISNSYWEGQQTALIEALATGCYSLAHAWKGVEEMLPPENIYWLDEELLEKIIAFSQLPDFLKNSKRAEMRSYAESKFDINSTKEKIVQLIEQESNILAVS